MENNIPKIINYCWFGGNKKSKLIEKCIKSWKKYCPDYEIVEWNEHNFDVNINSYVKEAYENKKWAFVSDYARLWVIYTNGGIYLDTDVELVNSLDSLLQYDVFFASENNKMINTGLGIGAKKGNEIIKEILDSYENIHFCNNNELDLTPCPTRNTKTLVDLLGNDLKGQMYYNKNKIIFLSSDYFCPFNHTTGEMKKTKNTIGIHWFNASWRDKKINIRERLLRPIKRIMGIEKFNKFFKK